MFGKTEPEFQGILIAFYVWDIVIGVKILKDIGDNYPMQSAITESEKLCVTHILIQPVVMIMPIRELILQPFPQKTDLGDCIFILNPNHF